MALDKATTATGFDVAVDRHDYPHLGMTNLRHEKFMQQGRPLAFRKVAHQRSSTGQMYPDDGNMVVQSATSTTIVLPANMPVTGIDFVNLLAVIVQGTGVGQWRQIFQMNTGTRTATISGVTPPGYSAPIVAPWNPVPDSTSRVVLLVDLFELNQVQWKIEYADDPTRIRVRPVLFAVPQLDPSGNLRAPEVILDNEFFDVDNLQSTYLPSEPSYRHGLPVQRQTRGALGGKLLVESPYLNGTAAYSIWGSGS